MRELAEQIEQEGIERVIYGKGLAEMKRINRLLVDALTSSETVCKLTKPAQVGNTIFGVGIDERTVIERAQREHDYRQRPEPEAVRINQANRFVRSLHIETALAELVELKGMKDALDDHAAGVKLLGEEWFRINEDYRRRKPLAWQRAREVLQGFTEEEPHVAR